MSHICIVHGPIRRVQSPRRRAARTVAFVRVSSSIALRSRAPSGLRAPPGTPGRTIAGICFRGLVLCPRRKCRRVMVSITGFHWPAALHDPTFTPGTRSRGHASHRGTHHDRNGRRPYPPTRLRDIGAGRPPAGTGYGVLARGPARTGLGRADRGTRRRAPGAGRTAARLRSSGPGPGVGAQAGGGRWAGAGGVGGAPGPTRVRRPLVRARTDRSLSDRPSRWTGAACSPFRPVASLRLCSWFRLRRQRGVSPRAPHRATLVDRGRSYGHPLCRRPHDGRWAHPMDRAPFHGRTGTEARYSTAPDPFWRAFSTSVWRRSRKPRPRPTSAPGIRRVTSS